MNKELLENKIKRHSYDYYVLSNPTISDVEFDTLYEELKEKYPESEVLKIVGNDSIEGFPKGTHLMTMGSQEKIKTEKQLIDWIKNKEVQFPLIAQLKLDGISIEIQYEKGNLVCALTRGDSVVGDNITSNYLKMKGAVSEIYEGFTGSIRGEILLEKKLFESKYKPKGFANPRNLSSGIAKSKFGTNCEDLTVICYDVFSSEMEFRCESNVMLFLKCNDFICVDTATDLNCSNEVLELVERFRILNNENEFDFSIDGVVIKQFIINKNDKKKLRPDSQRAFKWEDIGVETTLRSVEWSRSGVIYTPIANFDTVEIEGTQVSKASLANYSFIKILNLAINDTISVSKRNMIIPKVEKVIFRPKNRVEIEIPEFCTCCGTYLTRIDKKIFCSNPHCSGLNQQRISKWISTLEINGFGDVLQEYLTSCGILTIADLYNEELVKTSIENAKLKENMKKAFKRLNAIKEIPIEKFISGFNLEGIGESLVKNVVDSGFNTIDLILNVQVEDLRNILLFGEERAIKFVAEIGKIRDQVLELRDLHKFEVVHLEPETTTGILKNKSFCITGKLEVGNRKELKNLILRNDGLVLSSVKKELDYLIINDENSQSSKAVKARKLHIELISEKAFYDMLDDFYELLK